MILQPTTQRYTLFHMSLVQLSTHVWSMCETWQLGLKRSCQQKQNFQDIPNQLFCWTFVSKTKSSHSIEKLNWTQKSLIISFDSFCNIFMSYFLSEEQTATAICATCKRMVCPISFAIDNLTYPMITSKKPQHQRSHHPSLRQLHWLLIQVRISFKICLLLFKVKSGSALTYMRSLVIPCAVLESRQGLAQPQK